MVVAGAIHHRAVKPTLGSFLVVDKVASPTFLKLSLVAADLAAEVLVAMSGAEHVHDPKARI